MFDSRRIRHLNDIGYRGGKILYWTEGALRVNWNFGLAYACEYAQQKQVGIYCLATIDSDYAHTNVRQLVFLEESLAELHDHYQKKSLHLNIVYGRTQDILLKTVDTESIGMIVLSASYVRFFSDIATYLAKTLDIPVVLIDDSSLLPPWLASDHSEYGAYTLRKKYWRTVLMLGTEVDEKKNLSVESVGRVNDLKKMQDSDWYHENKINLQKISENEPTAFVGGESEAQKKWNDFLERKLEHYDTKRNDPNQGNTSHLSPYLHFGCISPLQIYYESLQLNTGNLPTGQAGSKLETPIIAFLEECFVRRELAINMWYHEKHPDQWNCLPDWVMKTLDEDRSLYAPLTRGDGGGLVSEYSLDDLRQGKTEDRLWNAAQHELLRTGKIHGYVRMYWGKQLLKWFPDWRKAYGIGVYLNDTYALDGCSPNGYTGIAWCFGKHDRPFPPKKIHYGLVRSMTFGGMKKKFDVEKYIQKWL